MNCRHCGRPLDRTRERFVECECVCAPQDAAEPPTKRNKGAPSGPASAAVFTSEVLRPEKLRGSECNARTLGRTAPSASAHRSVVSTNDQEANTSLGYRKARDKLQLLGNLLELDPDGLKRLQYESPGTKFAESPNRTSLQLMKTVIREVAKVIYPSDPDGLATRFISNDNITPPQTIQGMLTENVITAMKKTRRGTLARRYIRSVLCGTMTRADVNELLGFKPEHGENAQSIVTTGPNHEYRGFQRGGSTAVDAEEEDDEGDGDDCVGGTKLPRMSAKTFSRARRDWATLLETGELQPAKFGRARVRDEALEHLLTFLFEPENVVLLSWSNQRIVVNGKKLELPAVVGSKTGGVLYDNYCGLMQGKNKKPLSRGSFYAVAKTLTRREVRRVLPVDNMMQTLIRDPLILVRDIIHRTMPNQHRSKFFKQVDKVEWFLTNSFVNSHLGSDTSGFHDLDFALRSDVMQDDISLVSDRSVQCKGCLFPFLFLAEIKTVANIDEDSPDMETIELTYMQMMLYLRVVCRKAAQDKAMENCFKEILSKKLRNRVVVLMSHLTYEDAIRTGKSHLMPDDPCLSTHGSALFYLGGSSVDPANEHELAASHLETLHYTHFLRGNPHSSGEDRVIYALEALLHRISTDFPLAEEVVFVSDNSSCYKNTTLPCLVPRLSRAYGLRALRYIYSCSQVCEFLTDAQFEVIVSLAREKLMANQQISAEHIINCLHEEMRLPNLSVELLGVREGAKEYFEAENEFSCVLGYQNDIVYQERQVRDLTNPEQSGSVIARIREFSGIGKGVCFDIPDSSVGILRRLLLHPGNDVGQEKSGKGWIGPITGVEVIIAGKKLHATLHEKVPLPNGVSDGPIHDAIVRLRDWRQTGEILSAPNKADFGASHLKSKASPGRTCPDCRRSFKSESFQKSHNCKGSSLEKDVSARAVVVASEMLVEGKLPVFRDPSEQLSSSESKEITNVWFGWAQESIPEEFIESSYQLQYKREVFDILTKESGAGVRAIDVRNELQSKYPLRSDIPSEKRIKGWLRLNEATKRIQPFYIAPVAGAAIVSFNDDPKGAGGGRSRMNHRYTEKITAMHHEHLMMPEVKRPKPRNMYKEFEKYYRDDQGRLPSDFPDQRQVMNKINALRTKSKQRYTQ
eukprot:GFKZ01005650.1.p1 GENE.GFKZ01005650.1~~GFKZ01005650.1.p1  ORF type:complete len:1142 (+),score=141.57 GFKZ01005650.1:128-3553(+)